LDIDIATDKQTYNVGEQVTISTNITLDGNPIVSLAAIEIQNPNENPYLIRTAATGDLSGINFRVQILDIYTCNAQGVPQTTFNPGTFAYANLTIKNIDNYNSYPIKAGIYVQSSLNTPILAFYPLAMEIEKGQTVSILFSIPIPPDAPQGEAKIFASLFTDSPKNMGYPHCPEKTATFYITTTTPMPPQPQYINIIFNFPNQNVKLGNYTIYATAHYIIQTKIEMKQFAAILIGDIVKDGKINARDITACILLFRTTPQSPNWNPEADVVKDGIIDARDVMFLVLSFGKTAIY
jgi:hypothetical protein